MAPRNSCLLSCSGTKLGGVGHTRVSNLVVLTIHTRVSNLAVSIIHTRVPNLVVLVIPGYQTQLC